MTPDLLREAGELLYGDHWQTPLAADIGVSARTMRRWVSGDWPVPEGAWGDIVTVAESRAGTLSEWLARVRRHGGDECQNK